MAVDEPVLYSVGPAKLSEDETACRETDHLDDCPGKKTCNVLKLKALPTSTAGEEDTNNNVASPCPCDGS